jgi:hypothetical protein
MNFWSDIFNSSCKATKNVLYILYYNTMNIKCFVYPVLQHSEYKMDQ